jgi:Phage integrase, N-terminal SAM-like domain/Uncharacterized ACR, COG1678
MSDSAAVRRSPLGLFPGQPTPRLFDCVVETLRSRHHSRSTEEAYIHLIRRFLAFHGDTHPRGPAESDVNRFLTHLAVSETWLRPRRTRGEKLAASGSQTRVYAGICGWSVPQFDDETRGGGAWTVVRSTAATVFDEQPETLWKRLTRTSIASLTKAPRGPNTPNALPVGD